MTTNTNAANTNTAAAQKQADEIAERLARGEKRWAQAPLARRRELLAQAGRHTRSYRCPRRRR